MLRLVKTPQEKAPEPNAYLPREFRTHALKIGKDVSDEEIEQTWVDSRLKRVIKTPSGRFGNTNRLILKEAPEMGLPEGLSSYEILRIQELIEFKAVEKKKRIEYSRLLFGHKNATWEDVYEYSGEIRMEELDRIKRPRLAVDVLDDYTDYKYLYVLDIISENQTKPEKIRLLAWKCRNKIQDVWQAVSERINF
ncbi:hypothetical protein ACFL6I_11375 [candidate division KSB1 bacterium]